MDRSFDDPCETRPGATSSEAVTRELDAVLREQKRYYAERAGEYDEAYSPAQASGWQHDMARLVAAFDAVDLHGEIIELAAGTGVWTERLVERSSSLTVLDASTEMLDVNRRRLGASAARVTYEVVDLFEWRPPRRWDACVFAFWLAKVPDARLGAFLAAVRACLRPGGLVCCVDKTADAEPSSEYEGRTLNDGRRFTIVDHPRPPARIAEAFAAAQLDVSVEVFGPRFSLTHGVAR